MELAPYPTTAGQVVKASKGHFPQPFLISIIKELGAKIIGKWIYGQIFS
jgi:hypothetical protein